MSKLSAKNKFLDLSDYGRPLAKIIAKLLLKTPATPVFVTFCFLIAGLIAVYFIVTSKFILAALFLVLKSIIDGADGELARLRNKPSYIGRYLDSVFDFLLNFIILYAISTISHKSFLLMIVTFLCLQLQGTFYNYYYTILRNNLSGGDTTSRIEEKSFPKALHGENQKMVNLLFITYLAFYGIFDQLVLLIDQSAKNCTKIPSWFMSLISIYGLGFQLLIIGVMLIFHLSNYIIPFFIIYTFLIIPIVGIRKLVLPKI